MSRFDQLDLPEQDTWTIYDSTKIMEMESCPRKFFFKYILGWSPVEGSNLHLEFGSAVHLAMEILATDGYTPEAMAKAFEVFHDHYRIHFSPEMDMHNGAKTPDNFLRGLPQYCAQYGRADEEQEVLKVEIAGVVHVSETQLLHFKMDTLRKGPEGYNSLEHKTGSYFNDRWTQQWRQRLQVGTYSHVLYSLFPRDEIFGVVINGMFFHNPPRLKKDGVTPYAGDKDNEFHRVPVRMSPEQMEGWRVDALRLVESIQQNMEMLMETDDGDLVMHAFPRSRDACTDYGVCPYLNICSTNMNPVRGATLPPPSMDISFWDPRHIPTVKERLEL